MNRMTLCAASIACALASTAMAAPSAPSVDVYGSNNLQFSKIELAMETTAGYNQMVKILLRIEFTGLKRSQEHH